MSFERRIAYSALLCPAGVHVVAYREARGQLRVERYSREMRSGLTGDQAATILADLLEAEGARKRRVSIAVTGFGTCHQILTLPRAGREILEPIVVRELRRFYPDLFAADEMEPIVDFVEVDPSDESPGPQRELLVAAIPRGFLHSVAAALSAREIQLEHWTIVPRAMQRLFDVHADPDATAAAVVMVPGWPLVGFFHAGELRLFSEPRSASGSSDTGIDGVIEHVERGTIFLRQQFRGATVSRVYLAAGTEAPSSSSAARLREKLSLPLAHFGPLGEAPGAFAALGAALDSRDGAGLNLLPPSLRPASQSDLWTRRLALASAGVLLLASAWWGWQASRSEAVARENLAALASELSARSSALSQVRPIIDERQAHAQRAALLELLSRDRRRLPEILWPLQSAEPDVRVEGLSISQQEEGWAVTVGVRAVAMSHEAATDAIEAVVQQLGAELPEDALTVSGMRLNRATPADTLDVGFAPVPIAASVEMSFIVPALKDPVQ